MHQTPRALPEAYEGLEPTELWRHFAALNTIPRPSGHEEAARRYVQDLAREAGAAWDADEAGNLVVRLPAAGSPPDSPTVIVQSHLDMVCEALPGTAIDWLRDPIRPRREGDEIRATGTTLGADNGIGAAAALALITTPGLSHGPLELLFTVEEEVGLLGALALDGSLLNGRLLVNLDSEDPEELTIGAAGGRDMTIRSPLSTRGLADGGYAGWQLSVSGLKGGHSGVQIAEPLANAIKLLTDLVRTLRSAGSGVVIGDVAGGSRSNAIPRTATAHLAVPAGEQERFDLTLAASRDAVYAAWAGDEPGLTIEALPAPVPEAVLGDPAAGALLAFLEGAPHGVLGMSPRFPTKVQTSCNLARVTCTGGRLDSLISVRSLEEPGLDEAEGRVRSAAQAHGFVAETVSGYPAWSPDPDSELCQAAVASYQETYGRPARVEVIHAGLECGVIAARVPQMQTISFGPRITSPHTPDEHVLASTVTSTWKLLIRLLARLASGA